MTSFRSVSTPIVHNDLYTAVHRSTGVSSSLTRTWSACSENGSVSPCHNLAVSSTLPSPSRLPWIILLLIPQTSWMFLLTLNDRFVRMSWFLRSASLSPRKDAGAWTGSRPRLRPRCCRRTDEHAYEGDDDTKAAVTGYVLLQYRTNDDEDERVAVVVAIAIDALPDAAIVVFIIIKINSINKTSVVMAEPKFIRYGRRWPTFYSSS
mmetsp:Transcript_1825/g.4229  ORF Transcript_1825/g.4229 Transcript_1825/m.4229 type:complete len:207 (+) Transcript_1825:1635-2255(+)